VVVVGACLVGLASREADGNTLIWMQLSQATH
jgi:hypothetical protein